VDEAAAEVQEVRADAIHDTAPIEAGLTGAVHTAVDVIAAAGSGQKEFLYSITKITTVYSVQFVPITSGIN
jgi:hypothetical protein